MRLPAGSVSSPAMPPSWWTPSTEMRTQQFGLPLRQAMHWPQER